MNVVIDEHRLADIGRRYKVREMALFGSVIRDDFTATSDVDVLVEFEPDSPVQSLFDFIVVKHALEDEIFHRDVDLVDKSTVSPYIVEDVLKARRIIYAAAQR